MSPWQELNEEEAKEAAKCAGFLVCGRPGVGKSFWVCELVAQLWAEGKTVNYVTKQRGASIICLADFGQFEAIAQN